MRIKIYQEFYHGIIYIANEGRRFLIYIINHKFIVMLNKQYFHFYKTEKNLQRGV